MIINSDDFGMDKFVDEACLELNRKKKLNSISVIVNYPQLKNSISSLKKFNGFIGLHVNLTQQSPLSNKCKSLVKNSQFYGLKKFILNYLCSKFSSKDIYEEIEQQILYLKSHNINISHIDSHQHIHHLPKIWNIVNNLAIKYKIPRVRRVNEKVKIDDNLKLKLKKLIFLFLNNINKKYNNIEYLDFIGLSLQEENNHKKNFQKIIQNYNNKRIEVMVHLGTKDFYYKSEKIKFGRIREYKTLNDIKFKV